MLDIDQQLVAEDVQEAKVLVARAGTLVRLLPLALVIIIISLAAYAGLYEPASSFAAIAVVCTLSFGLLMIYTRYVLQFAWFSAPLVYLYLLWCFYFGLAFTSVLVPTVLNAFEPRAIEWFYQPETRLAMMMALLAGTWTTGRGGVAG